MSHHLINRGGVFPPGGYPYTDPRTKMIFNGMEADFYGQVQKILNHRLANPNLYPRGEVGQLDPNSIAAQLDTYQCQRLGNHSKYCLDGNAPAVYPGRELRTQPSNQVCGKCGGQLLAVGCATCASFRISSYKCPQCGWTRGV